MLSPQQSLAIALIVAFVPRASAQYYNGYDASGNSYAERIGIGVGVALVIALLVLFVGYIMRRRRARAFKQAYPTTRPQMEGGIGGGNYGGGVNDVPLQQQPPYIPGYQQQPQYQEAPAYTNYRPDASGYTPNAYQNQEVSQGNNSYNNGTPHYAPPTSPPPQEQASHQQHYAPPPGPPPAAYNPANVPQK